MAHRGGHCEERLITPQTAKPSFFMSWVLSKYLNPGKLPCFLHPSYSPQASSTDRPSLLPSISSPLLAPNRGSNLLIPSRSFNHLRFNLAYASFIACIPTFNPSSTKSKILLRIHYPKKSGIMSNCLIIFLS